MKIKTKRCRICRIKKPKNDFLYKDKTGEIIKHRRCLGCSTRLGNEDEQRRPAA